MNRNSILTALIVLLLLAGPLLWLAIEDRSVAPPPPPAPPRSAAPAPEPVAPKPPGGRAAAKGEVTVAPAATPIERAPSARIAVVARITLLGAESAAPADTYLKLRVAPHVNRPRRTAPETLELHEGPDPSFDIDVTDLFAGFVPGFELEVGADRAGFLPATARVRVSRLVSVGGKPAVVPVAVNLVLAGEAAGLVQDDHNRPVARGAVGSYALVAGHLEPVDTTATDEDGRFRLRLRPGEVHVIVAAAKGLLPSTAQIRGVAGETAPATGLVLYEGHAIAGRVSVRVRGGPPPGLRVLAFPSAGGEAFQLGEDFYAYRDGRVVRRPGTAGIDDDGTYRVTGLAPEDHIVSLECPQMLAEVANSTAVRSVAPREGVDLSLDAAWSAATVRGPKGLLPEATVALRVVTKDHEKYRNWTWDNSTPSAAGLTDAEGIAWFLAPEDVRYSITVEAEGHVADRKLATTPFSQTIEMREVPDTSLALTLISAQEDGGQAPLPPRVEVRFYDVRDPQPFPSFVRRAEVTGHSCLVRGLVAGEYHVEVLARPQGWYLMAATDVKLAWQQTAGATVKLARGGRVHVVIRGPSGAPGPGTYRVLDAAGIEHAAGSVSAVASESAEAPLVAGDYRVAVTPADGAEQTVPVAVEVAKTARVEVSSPPVR